MPSLMSKGCEEVVFKGVELVYCGKEAVYLSEELRAYCSVHALHYQRLEELEAKRRLSDGK